MTDFLTWLGEVFGHWQNWLSGSGVGGAVLLLLYLWERLTGRVVGKRMYAAIVIVAFLFAAFFVSWRDQFREAQALRERLRSPDLKLEFGMTWWGSRDGHLMFIASGLLSNPHGPDSGAVNWELSLLLPDSTVVHGTLIPRRNDNLVVAGGDITFIPSEYWPTRTNEPIKAGASVPGWIWFVFPSLTEEQFRKLGHVTLTLSVDDVVSSQTHRAMQVIGDTSKGIDLPWNPQTTQKP